MKHGTNKPARAYPYLSPQLVSLVRTTPSGRGWFETSERYRVKKPFHTLPTSANEIVQVRLGVWRRFVLFIRRVVKRFFP